jgi:hypothetical protein
MHDNDIFFALTRGVDSDALAAHVDELRVRGYSVFDVPKRDRVDVEIVSPDCIQYWEVSPGMDGRWRLQ